ncbi:hypothetical protein PAALTS15_14491 [Paenibacillus alvei TS-15]|uniref:Uncharacterized protein n=1 Tax=Paenibacillus alvei TS-15 TaxID=1117108 RepID=S9TVR5_PAEAL|nr:hypothetical protein PAALTS15_14491 [Paenibacillus alvei TS-15]
MEKDEGFMNLVPVLFVLHIEYSDGRHKDEEKVVLGFGNMYGCYDACSDKRDGCSFKWRVELLRYQKKWLLKKLHC